MNGREQDLGSWEWSLSEDGVWHTFRLLPEILAPQITAQPYCKGVSGDAWLRSMGLRPRSR